jgi:prepilin-type processing-associated H-X9-DG protein
MPIEPVIEHRPFQFTLRTMFIVMTVFAFLLGSVLWGIRYAQDSAQTKRCADTGKMLGIGIWNYADNRGHGSFPPAYTGDAQGRRMHSWRLLVYPYMFCIDVPEYRRDEPWDGPNNRKLHGDVQLANAYRCPADLSEPRTATNFLAVVGPGAAWAGTTPGYSTNRAKGNSHTALLVEAANSGIHWLEPRDLDLSTFDPTINGRSGRGISSRHAGGANVVFVDGSVRCLSADTSREVVEAMLTTGTAGDVSPDKSKLNPQSSPDQEPSNTE